jgi:integrating conjugative element membrane protein (TIGR03745 family)
MSLDPLRLALRAACAAPRLLRCRLTTLRARVTRLGVAAWTLLLCHPAWADLPTMVVPDDVEDGDFLGLTRSTIRVALNIVILALGAIAFYTVAAGALTKWNEYRKGRIELADIKEYVVAGSLVLAVVVALLTIANSVL